MGYYTRFSLSVISGDDHETDYEKEIGEISEYGSCFEDTIKWYSYQEDMKVLSLRHPNTLFKLSGVGEESGDLWNEYYLNGKFQRCKAIVSYEEYDESKLV